MYYSWLITFLDANGCEPNEYQCQNKKCVLKTWRCDSDDDCGDGSDELECSTSPPGALCQYHQFTCHSNNQCIPRSYHCDNEKDCIDGSDEVGCCKLKYFQLGIFIYSFLFLSAKPVISKPPPPMVHLHQHDTLIITCTAVGIPTPEIVWRLNWGHIPPKCRTTSVNGVGELICEDIQAEDQGAYSCEAINIKGSVFAVPDTILVVQKQSPCRPGYFNDDARSESECIKCFCFGHTTNCHSADLFIYQVDIYFQYFFSVNIPYLVPAPVRHPENPWCACRSKHWRRRREGRANIQGGDTGAHITRAQRSAQYCTRICRTKPIRRRSILCHAWELSRQST